MRLFVLVLLGLFNSSLPCDTFYEGYCSGPADCMCTKHEGCSLTNPDGTVPKPPVLYPQFNNQTSGEATCESIGGTCYTVIHDECSGPDSCMNHGGVCSGPSPPPTPPPPHSTGFTGVDTAGAVSVSSWECMKRAGVSYMAARVFTEDGTIDHVGLDNIKNAHAAGLKLNGYIFPCFTCGARDGGRQVNETVDALKSAGLYPHMDMIFFDIEWAHWSSDGAVNEQFVTDMVHASDDHKDVKWGVYSSEAGWKAIFKTTSYSIPAQHGLRIWYADWDGSKSWAGWHPFGGWTKPYAKQLVGDGHLCDIQVDIDWME